MHKRSQTRLIRLVVPLAALALLAACSSSNNNKNKANNGAANAPVATTVAAAASPAAPASPAPVRASSATAAAVTPKPASPVSGAATSGRSPTAGAAAAQPGSCSGPAAGSAAAAVTSTPAPGASADEKLLRAAALTLADLPSGYDVQSAEAAPPSDPNQTANYSVTFTCIGQGGSGLNIQAIVDGLFSFTDAATTANGFKQLPAQITQQAGEDFKLTPVTPAPKVGDETLAYKVSGSTQGITLGGYALIWRHGRFGVALIQVGAPAVGAIDDVAALAQKQDSKLPK